MDRFREYIINGDGLGAALAAAKRENDRCARALAVAQLFSQRSRAACRESTRGARAYLRSLVAGMRLGSAERQAEVYRERLSALPRAQLNDRGLARFIFGHSDLGLTTPAHDEQPTPIEIELWEALGRLVDECHRQGMEPSLPLIVAKFTRDRRRLLMQERRGSMIRALIGRFVLGCIEAHKGQRFLAKIEKVDLAKLTDAQISDFVHGRPIDWTKVEPAALRSVSRS